MMKNRDTIQKSLDILTRILAKHVLPLLKAAFGNDWYYTAVYTVLPEPQSQMPLGSLSDLEIARFLDAHAYLKLLAKHWNSVFASGHFCKFDVVRRVIDVRNRVAHIGPQDLSDTYMHNAIESVANLCEQFDVEAGQEIRELLPQPRVLQNLPAVFAQANTTLGKALSKNEAASAPVGPTPNPVFGGLPIWSSLFAFNSDPYKSAHSTLESLIAPNFAPEALLNLTYLTTGLRQLTSNLARRLSGKSSQAIFCLNSAAHSGKTHALLLQHSLFSGLAPASKLDRFSFICREAQIKALPQVHTATLRCAQLDPQVPRSSSRLPGIKINTLWGEMTAQLSRRKPRLYDQIKHIDSKRVTPGVQTLRSILKSCGTALIQLDNIEVYLQKVQHSTTLGSNAYANLITFLKDLVQVAEELPTVAVVFTQNSPLDQPLTPLSEVLLSHAGILGSEISCKTAAKSTIGSGSGKLHIQSLSRPLQRLKPELSKVRSLFESWQGGWQPITLKERFSLAQGLVLGLPKSPQSVQDVCRHFWELYRANPEDFPEESRQEEYLAQLQDCYPFHPTLVAGLCSAWAPLPEQEAPEHFLRLISSIATALRKAGDNNLLIMPGSLHWHSPQLRLELASWLPSPWTSIILEQISGPDSKAAQLKESEEHSDLAQRCARSLLFYSSPRALERGCSLSKLKLAGLQPGENVVWLEAAFERLQSECSNLHSCATTGSFWFDTKLTWQRSLEQTAHTTPQSQVEEAIRTALGKQKKEQALQTIHVFPDESVYIDDSPELQVVFLRSVLKDSHEIDYCNAAIREANHILHNRSGHAPRYFKNRLIFVAAEGAEMDALAAELRIWLAKRHLSNVSKSSSKSSAKCSKELKQMEAKLYKRLAETFCWLLIPQPLRSSSLAQKTAEQPCYNWSLERCSGSQSSIFARIVQTLQSKNELVDNLKPTALFQLLQEQLWQTVEHVTVLDVFSYLGATIGCPRLTSLKTLYNAIKQDFKTGELFALADLYTNGSYVNLRYKQKLTSLDESNLLLSADTARKVIAEQECATALKSEEAQVLMTQPQTEQQEQTQRDSSELYMNPQLSRKSKRRLRPKRIKEPEFLSQLIKLSSFNKLRTSSSVSAPPEAQAPQEDPLEQPEELTASVPEDIVQEDIVQEDIVQEDVVQEDVVQEDVVQEDEVQEDEVQENEVEESQELELNALEQALLSGFAQLFSEPIAPVAEPPKTKEQESKEHEAIEQAILTGSAQIFSEPGMPESALEAPAEGSLSAPFETGLMQTSDSNTNSEQEAIEQAILTGSAQMLAQNETTPEKSELEEIVQAADTGSAQAFAAVPVEPEPKPEPSPSSRRNLKHHLSLEKTVDASELTDLVQEIVSELLPQLNSDPDSRIEVTLKLEAFLPAGLDSRRTKGVVSTCLALDPNNINLAN